MKQRIVALAVVMLAAAVTSFTADTSAADCQWNVVLPLMPSVGTKGHIWDISSTAPSDVWAAGEQRIRVGAKTTRSRPLLAHWDGNDWSVTSVPVPWGWVASIAARSRDEAWATVVNRYGIFLLRWRASGWRVVRRPQELGDDFDITLRREKLWLIGLVGSYIYAADGWRPLTALDQILPDARIVTSRASDEIWRIRNTHEFPGSGRIVRPVSIVERWERTEWVSTPLSVPRFTDFTGLVAFSRHDAWLAGTNGYHGYLLRWDGSRWRRVAGLPHAAIDAYVFGSRSDAVYVTGSTYDGVSTFPPYLRRFDGRQWTTVTPPTQESSDGFTLYPVGRSELWATTVLDDDIKRLSC